MSAALTYIRSFPVAAAAVRVRGGPERAGRGRSRGVLSGNLCPATQLAHCPHSKKKKKKKEKEKEKGKKKPFEPRPGNSLLFCNNNNNNRNE